MIEVVRIVTPIEIIPNQHGYTIIDNIGTILEVDDDGEVMVENSDMVVFEINVN